MNKKIISIVVVSCMSFVALLNISEAFSNIIFKVPGVGDAAKCVTIREINKKNDPVDINIENYKVTGVSEEVETIIRKNVSNKLNELSKSTKEEYILVKKDFIALEGKNKDYKKAQVNFKVDLKVVSEDTISFVITKNDDKKSGEIKRYAYNISLENASEITLKDIFGQDYKESIKAGLDKYISNESLKNKEIAEYYETYYKTRNVDFNEKTPFYINEKGNPVLMFDEREIAPREFGKQDVEIEK